MTVTDVSATLAEVTQNVTIKSLESSESSESFDSDDDFHSGCRNVSHCHRQQNFLGLPNFEEHAQFVLITFRNKGSFFDKCNLEDRR